jgi:hypothetical protein
MPCRKFQGADVRALGRSTNPVQEKRLGIGESLRDGIVA